MSPLDPRKMSRNARVRAAVERFGRATQSLASLATEWSVTEEEIAEAIQERDYLHFMRTCAYGARRADDDELLAAVEHDLDLFLAMLDEDDEDDDDFDGGSPVDETWRLLFQDDDD